MHDTYGLTFGTPFARFDRDSLCWRMFEDTLVSDSPQFSRTLPTWGIQQGGVLYERPMPELPISEPVSSSLPTPRTSDSNGVGRHGTGGPDLRTAVDELLPTPKVVDQEALTLFPTPIARDWKEQTLGWTWNRDGKTQTDTVPRAITSLLPMPTAQAAKHGETPDVTANGFGKNLWDLPSILGGSTSLPSDAGSE